MKKTKTECLCWGPSLLRVTLGLLFIVPGIMKLMNPAMPAGMLESLGFPAPVALAWVLLLSELVFGAALVLGFKVKYAIWPLVLILLVAIVTVHIPGTDPMKWINVLFHVVAIAGLISLFNSGAGAWALDKE